MEDFWIVARGPELAVDLLVHHSIITKREIMEWVLTTALLYEEFDAQVHVQAAVQIFKDGVTIYYIRVRSYLEGTEEFPQTRIRSIPEVLVQRIENICEVTRLKVGSSVIPDQNVGLTGCAYTTEKAINFQGNSVSIDKNLKKPRKRTAKEFDNEIAPSYKKQRQERPATTQPICFFCGRKGHRTRECRTEKDKWVDLDQLPASVKNIAKKVRHEAKKE